MFSPIYPWDVSREPGFRSTWLTVHACLLSPDVNRALLSCQVTLYFRWAGWYWSDGYSARGVQDYLWSMSTKSRGNIAVRQAVYREHGPQFPGLAHCRVCPRSRRERGVMYKENVANFTLCIWGVFQNVWSRDSLNECLKDALRIKGMSFLSLKKTYSTS